MSGSVNIEAGVCRVRREVHPAFDNTDFSTDVQLIKPLDDIFSRRRACKALIPFSDLPSSRRKDFYDKVADYFIDIQVADITHFVASENVARQFGLVIANCDRRTVHLTVRNRVMGKEKMLSLLGDTGDVTLAAEPTISAGYAR